jgi:hypothetical protein
MRSLVLMLALGGCRCEARLAGQTIDASMGQSLEERIMNRLDEINTMTACVNAALDSGMNDRDQVLTIEECVRKAGYR